MHLAVGAVVVEVTGNDDGLAIGFGAFLGCLQYDGGRATSGRGTQTHMDARIDIVLEFHHQHRAFFTIGCQVDATDAPRQFICQHTVAIATAGKVYRLAEHTVHARQLCQFLHLVHALRAGGHTIHFLQGNHRRVKGVNGLGRAFGIQFVVLAGAVLHIVADHADGVEVMLVVWLVRSELALEGGLEFIGQLDVEDVLQRLSQPGLGSGISGLEIGGLLFVQFVIGKMFGITCAGQQLGQSQFFGRNAGHLGCRHHLQFPLGLSITAAFVPTFATAHQAFRGCAILMAIGKHAVFTQRTVINNIGIF